MVSLNNVDRIEELQAAIDLGTAPLVTMAAMLEEELSTAEIPDKTHHIALTVLNLASDLKEALERLEADRVGSSRTTGKMLELVEG